VGLIGLRRPSGLWLGYFERHCCVIWCSSRAVGQQQQVLWVTNRKVCHCEQALEVILRMLGRGLLRCAMLCCAVLCCAVLCCAVLCAVAAVHDGCWGLQLHSATRQYQRQQQRNTSWHVSSKRHSQGTAVAAAPAAAGASATASATAAAGQQGFAGASWAGCTVHLQEARGR